MKEKEIRDRLESFLARLDVEELEAKIAPIDCTKKPNHPDCQPQVDYGGPVTKYGGTMRYGGPF